ncbi:MAG TPA: SDR family oxidoreductase [Chloroflexota bacterium]|jgi:NAD(P)-dependent dehydrogenase (short-subunit alcohol dehydrogenase family)
MSVPAPITPDNIAADPLVAMVTGAARGMGAAIARRLAADGLAVVLADRRREAIDALAVDIARAGGRAAALEVDLADAGQIERLEAAARATFGRLDVLVNNAGVILPKGFMEASVEEWDRMMAVNLRAVYLLCRAALPELRRRRGTIVNIASTAGLRAQMENGPYCVAKSGVIMLTQALAQEVRAAGVRVNCVCPGAVDTPLLTEYARARGTPESIDALAASGMLVPPEDAAATVSFLVSQGARSITGQVLVVDRGGLVAG